LKVAIQGFTGSFHAIATEKYFGFGQELVMCDSFPNLFKALNNRDADCAVMAIENTIAGTILFNYSLLRNSPYKIVGETFLRIEHCLLALPNQTIEDIKEVRSHPMALMQCMRFFSGRPEIRLLEDIDTAYMAELIAKNQTKGVAAVAGQGVAEKFGLQILKKNIEDSEQNFTRFLVIAKQEDAKPNQVFDQDKKPKLNKATLSFTLAHKLGALKEVTEILYNNHVNILTIQSTPLTGNQWEYIFYVDVEFQNIEDYTKTIHGLNRITPGLNEMGKYVNQLIIDN